MKKVRYALRVGEMLARKVVEPTSSDIILMAEAIEAFARIAAEPTT